MQSVLAGRFLPGRGARSLSVLRGPEASSAGEDFTCAWTGRLTGLERLAAEVGLPPDAEPAVVLAAAHRRMGSELLNRLRGAYVLALWDAETGRGLVGTDLIGQCAVFFTEDAGGLLFAAELRDLLPLLDTRPAPDELSVIHTLTRPGPPRGRTLYSGVMRLRSGECLELDSRGWTVERHWRPRYEEPLTGTRDEHAEALREAVKEAVGRSLEGVDRAAVFLSGGIDSSISASVAAGFEVDLRGYSAVFPDHPDVDETEYLDSVAAHSEIESRRFAIHPAGSLATALEYMRTWEIPVLGAGYLLERPLAAEAAADGMTVVLDGQGGDEVFGATPYVAADELRRGRLLQSVRTTQATPWTTGIPTRRARFGLWRSAALNPWIPDDFFAAVRRLRGRQPPAPAWLTPAGQQRYLESVDEREWKRGAEGPIWWRYMSDLLIHHASGVRCDYLRHRAAISGLEARPPLLDVDLALLALRLPPRLSMDPERDRPLARDAMRGILPEKVRTRTVKSDLSAFYSDITTQGDLADVAALLRDPACEVYRYVDRERMMRLAERPPGDNRLASRVQVDGLHACAIVECWLRRQSDPDSSDRLLERVESPAYSEVTAVPAAAS